MHLILDKCTDDEKMTIADTLKWDSDTVVGNSLYAEQSNVLTSI